MLTSEALGLVRFVRLFSYSPLSNHGARDNLAKQCNQ